MTHQAEPPPQTDADSTKVPLLACPAVPSERGVLRSRRTLLATGGAAIMALAGWKWFRHTSWPKLFAPNFLGEGPVFVARNQRYDGTLEQTIRDGLSAVGLDTAWLRGRRVLLKPNLVEPLRAAPHMTTDPAVVVAAAEVFRQLGATVTVGEGPGHVRDTELALFESRLGESLAAARLPFVDLNVDDVRRVGNRSRVSKLRELYLPESVLESDLVVSMPKLKTHHWVGMTAAMKNLYGVMPGIKYGWPKNVLHHAGIPESVVDINAALPRTMAIVDGIVCMEGDGPIMGSPRRLGLLLMGINVTAVDATCARIIGLDPTKVSYLRLADCRLGPIDDELIPMRGDDWRQLVTPLEMLDRPHLNLLRVTNTEGLTPPARQASNFARQFVSRASTTRLGERPA